jgi:hypothetical protein
MASGFRKPCPPELRVPSASVTALDTAITRPTPRLADGPTRDLAVVAVVALPFAVRYPIAASIVALAVFGVAHTVLELRWVLNRFRPMLPARLLAGVVALATVIALARLAGWPRPVEILAGFGLVALALVHGATTGRLPKTATAIGAAALAIGLAASLRTPGMYGIVLAHLHNLVTAVLLWEWRPDRRFRAGLVAVFAVIPALVLAGALDPALPTAIARTGPAHLLSAGITPPAWAATALGVRIVAVFAFLQAVHYGVWCWLLPRHAPVRPTAATGARVPAVVVIAFATALLAFVFRTDYATGRSVYASLATYHAYLEFPVVLVLLGGPRVR